jgi:hypothetical protein
VYKFRFTTLALSNFDPAATFITGCTCIFVAKALTLTFPSTAQKIRNALQSVWQYMQENRLMNSQWVKLILFARFLIIFVPKSYIWSSTHCIL